MGVPLEQVDKLPITWGGSRLGPGCGLPGWSRPIADRIARWRCNDVRNWRVGRRPRGQSMG
jgi:hypothetical protein